MIKSELATKESELVAAKGNVNRLELDIESTTSLRD